MKFRNQRQKTANTLKRKWKNEIVDKIKQNTMIFDTTLKEMNKACDIIENKKLTLQRLVWQSTLWINLISDESSTNYKLKRKEEKKKRIKNVRQREYLRLKMQKTRSTLNVLCLSQSKQLSFRNSFIIWRKSHHFSMRTFDDANSR